MLGLMKIGWISAALSAGVMAALPAQEAPAFAASSKQFTDRLGETETATQILRTGSRLAAPTTVETRLKNDRWGGATGTSGETTEQRGNGVSTLVKGQVRGLGR